MPRRPLDKSSRSNSDRYSFRTRWGLLLSILLTVSAVFIWTFWGHDEEYEPISNIAQPPAPGEYRPYDPGTAVPELPDSPLMKEIQKNLNNGRKSGPQFYFRGSR